MRKLIVAAVTLVFLAGCMGHIRNYMVDKGIENLNRIESYSGTAVETGLLDDGTAVRTKLSYVKPDMFTAEITEPAEYRGDRFVLSGDTMYLYYAKPNIGIEFRGLNSVIEDSVEKSNTRVKEKTLNNVKYFNSAWKGRQEVAGRKAYRFRIVPLEEGKYLYHEYFYSDPVYSLPLKVDLLDDTTPVYTFEYTDITFNEEIDPGEFRFTFPPETNISRWDLGKKGLTLAQVKKAMNFRVALPSGLPESMKLAKAVKAPGFIPACCLVYYDGLYNLILTEIKDYGIEAVKPRGIRTGSPGRDARLLFSGDNVIITWKRKGVILTLTGNLPYYEMLSIAENIE